MSHQNMTPGWTSQDEHEYNALRERFIASSTRRRLFLERMRAQRLETVNERRGLRDWVQLEDMMEEDTFDPDVPQAGQGSNRNVSCCEYLSHLLFSLYDNEIVIVKTIDSEKRCNKS